MTENLLSRYGHSTQTASDGLEFLSKINCDTDNNVVLYNYDVVLMDDNMPNLCGPDACKIARDRGYKGVIFGVTGNKDPVQISNFISQGANQIFSKPLDLDKLRDAIDLKVV
jgi:CheY-like chemotaxis protein